MRHLDTLKEYAEAFKASDIPRIRAVQARISREFGESAATNVNTAAHILGPEIIKALGVAGAGGETERANAAAQFSAVASMPQLDGAVGVTQKLFAGQLEGKRGQAKDAGVSEEKFKNLVGERPYELLNDLGKGGTTSAAHPLTLDGARSAIKAGAPRDAVIKRMKENGLNPGEL
jgi:hypothetical protein